VEIRVSQGVTLMQAIAKAGGATEGARRSGVVITRRDKAGKETRQRINLNSVMSGRLADPFLQDGDVVHVPTSIF
jgi:protein involved in polysaccharide export with SLBB domain